MEVPTEKSALVAASNIQSFAQPMAVTLTMKMRAGGKANDHITASANLRHFLNRLNARVFGSAAKRYGRKLRIFPVIEQNAELAYQLELDSLAETEWFTLMPKEFKSGLDKMLKGIADDVELGEIFTKEFDPNLYEEHELHYPLHSLFERSKLNPRHPGHWQFLLAIVAGVIYPERTGRKTFWDNEREDKLFRAVLKRRRADRKAGAKSSIESICKGLVSTEPYKKIDPNTLHARFNIVLRKKRSQAKSRNASPTLVRELKWFASN